MHKALKVLIGSSFFITFSAGLLGPIYAIFVLGIGGNILDASTAWATYSIVMGVLVVVFGKIEDSLNLTKMLLIGRLLNIFGILGYFFVTSPVHLFLVQAVLGIAAAVKNPSWYALFAKNLTKGKESSQWATVDGLDYISVGIAAIIGGVVASTLGFRALFSLMFVTASISFIITGFLLRKPIPKFLKV